MKEKKHNYHLVDPSPWPLSFSISVLVTAAGAVGVVHKWDVGIISLAVGIFLTTLTLFNWWKDIISEAIKEQCFTAIVKKGLRLSMAIIILSETMFFAGFFASFFKSWLLPVRIFNNFSPTSYVSWPPANITPLDPWSIPFLNTVILLLSGCTLTWSHYSLINNDVKNASKLLGYTVILGFTFSIFQIIEYYHIDFAFKETGEKAIYSSNFYMLTGFHGIHVIIGTLFLLICWVRSKRNQLLPECHIGFECAVWYWHFVDVIWLLLFFFVYLVSS
ncbi:cytochrome c oxidase subunit 3 [Neoehrlichia mikurensis]|uniref:cytochrome-c oxidase n=1 Tax=Neoehrlichia mikurensis TaxID=89586 RepID=A0A9Q9F3Z5_9RICK|nr:cytochrome c oxidase subunit 3 [Neoehrlichia mikurensis]QXK92321.1 cytochrome c oxidase subunit 3 [Neoehrlichia mikurensis]QXK92775.1 cytochrome c oxidase subunit 3 [Neoehrlichia mikurensis]QXK94016.1 cytochrome c oxidase subunit 3 [Neoehrlichia mikurensis]UTO55820.1 cytochrome c oxidase subunit 3 [Neoehrlichia mikurensis]UTO56735.1 cytochrome c oxidase subunit 3 [Neoehrlichia mikurensis]